jgi:hypothetical protein
MKLPESGEETSASTDTDSDDFLVGTDEGDDDDELVPYNEVLFDQIISKKKKKKSAKTKVKPTQIFRSTIHDDSSEGDQSVPSEDDEPEQRHWRDLMPSKQN